MKEIFDFVQKLAPPEPGRNYRLNPQKIDIKPENGTGKSVLVIRGIVIVNHIAYASSNVFARSIIIDLSVIQDIPPAGKLKNRFILTADQFSNVIEFREERPVQIILSDNILTINQIPEA